MLYGIIADIHSNLEAFRAVLDQLSAVERIVCAGDIVGYGPNPNEGLELLAEKNIASVAGNHDKAAVGELSTQWFNINARLAVEWTASQLKAAQADHLRSLPINLELDDFQIVHGSLRDPLEEYIFSLDEAEESIKLMTKPLCFVGHTHRPLYAGLKPGGSLDGRTLGKNDNVSLGYYTKTLVNPGSVGQPRDNDPRASFGILDTRKKEFVLRRVEYDIEAVQHKMLAANLPDYLIERLAIGT